MICCVCSVFGGPCPSLELILFVSSCLATSAVSDGLKKSCGVLDYLAFFSVGAMFFAVSSILSRNRNLIVIFN